MPAYPVFHYHPGLLTKKPSMYDAPFCTPRKPYLSHGGGHLATEDKTEVTCKRCLAKMISAPKAPKVPAKVRRVEITITDRHDGTSCIQVFQGNTDLLFEVVRTHEAPSKLEALLETYPGAKTEVF
jgi:hypothetical protein